MSLLNRTLRYLSLWLRPPKIATLRVEEIDHHTLPFVSPIFVLSTGRCGTKWLTELLRQDPHIRVNHSDYPELIRHSRLAYEQYSEQPCMFQEIIRATRDGYILDAYRRNQIYVETNNRITFFADAIRAVYPKARFVHLVRHPGDFVRSGLRRDWYKGESHDIGRIRNISNPALWDTMTDIEKIAWLWNETNQYIETFLKTIEPETFVQAKAENMFTDTQMVKTIIDFIGAKLGSHSIETMLAKKVNQQMVGHVVPYEQWSTKEKKQLERYTPLVERYGYVL